MRAGINFAIMWIDVVFAAVVALAFYQGYSRGIIGTVVSIAALVLGFLLAVRHSREITGLLADLFNVPAAGALPLIGFVVTFVLTLFAMRLIAAAVERVLSALRLAAVNRALGGLAAAILATFLLSLALLAFESTGLLTREQRRDSITYESLAAFPDQVRGVFQRSRPALERVRVRGEDALEEAKRRRKERREG